MPLKSREKINLNHNYCVAYKRYLGWMAIKGKRKQANLRELPRKFSAKNRRGVGRLPKGPFINYEN